MNEKTPPQSEEDQLRTAVELLFYQYVDRDPEYDLRTIADYFEYLAQRVDHDEMLVHVPFDLLGQFEAVCLLLKDRLRSYPESVQVQVTDILKAEDLPRIFAVLASLSEHDIYRIRRRRYTTPMLAFFRRFLGPIDQSEPPLEVKSLFAAKIALRRLGQIVRYASTIELPDYDAETEDMKDHYDPSLVDKAKIIALVNLLKVQVGTLPDEAIRSRLTERINTLEEEIRKPRPRWGRIIAGFFVLFSFVADLRSISPTTYETLYETARAIIQTLHEEGSVEHHRKRPLLPTPHPDAATLPKALSPQSDGEDGAT